MNLKNIFSLSLLMALPLVSAAQTNLPTFPPPPAARSRPRHEHPRPAGPGHSDKFRRGLRPAGSSFAVPAPPRGFAGAASRAVRSPGAGGHRGNFSMPSKRFWT